jgi:hypothetical protein
VAPVALLPGIALPPGSFGRYGRLAKNCDLDSVGRSRASCGSPPVPRYVSSRGSVTAVPSTLLAPYCFTLAQLASYLPSCRPPDRLFPTAVFVQLLLGTTSAPSTLLAPYCFALAQLASHLPSCRPPDRLSPPPFFVQLLLDTTSAPCPRTATSPSAVGYVISLVRYLLMSVYFLYNFGRMWPGERFFALRGLEVGFLL